MSSFVRPSMRRRPWWWRHGTAAKPDLSVKALIRISYVATVSTVVVGIAIGTQAESIKSIWCGCLPASSAHADPNVLRCIGGASMVGAMLPESSRLGAATLLALARRSIGSRAVSRIRVRARHLLASLAGVVGSLLTPATPIAVLETFYTRVRPFGSGNQFGPLRCSPQIASAHGGHQCRCGGLCTDRSFLSVFFLIGHYFSYFGTGSRRPAVWHHPLSLLVKSLPTTCAEQ